MKLMMIGRARVETSTVPWNRFAVGGRVPSGGQDLASLRTGLIHPPAQTVTVDEAQRTAIARQASPDDLQQTIFARGNPAWHRLDPLTVTIKTASESYYVLKRIIEKPRSSGNNFPGLTLFAGGGRARDERPVTFTGWGDASVDAYGASPKTITHFLSEMKAEGLAVPELGPEASSAEREHALGSVVLQIYNLLDAPKDIPERTYGNLLEEALFLNDMAAFGEELESLSEQIGAWLEARRNPASDVTENPVQASATLWQRRIDGILSGRLTPKAVTSVIYAMSYASVSAAPFLEAFFKQNDVRGSIQEWNQDPQARRALIADFLYLVYNTIHGSGYRDVLWQFYGLKLLGLRVKNLAEFETLRDNFIARELGNDWQSQYGAPARRNPEGANAKQLNDAIAKFYAEQFALVINPAITEAVLKDKQNIEKVLASFSDEVILAQRKPKIAPTIIMNHGTPGEA